MQQGKRTRQTNFFQNLDDGLGRVGGSGKDFQHPDSSALDPNAVSKSTTSIDGDPKVRRLRAARHCREGQYCSTWGNWATVSSAAPDTRARAPAPHWN